MEYQQIEEAKLSVNNKSENLIGGAVGAFLGSLIGVVLWVIIGKLGYIAGIAGAVMAISALFGYEKLGRKLGKKGTVICIIILIVMVYFSTKLSWAIDAYDAFKEEEQRIGIFEAYKILPQLIKENNIQLVFYKDLMIGYALTFIASAKTIANALKSN